MRVKKILLALCILLLAFPSWAASRVIQGDAQFVYSQEIDEAVNPKIGEEQEFVGFDPEGEPIYTTIPIYKYTSITSPTVTLGNVATIFPLNLDGMVFNVSYSSVSGKPGIYPGVFTFQFSKSEILMLPNGAVIMDEIENSTSPVDVLFKYFDPVFVIYGTDGEKVSINVKNFPLNFSFVTGSYEDMAISFPVVLADGYPDTFCIEQVNGYLFVYDAMVSQENAGVISDGKIEVAFALVPNEKATNIARQDFPILELYEQGYVIFDDPSKYLNIPEMIGVSSAALSSGETSFVEIENGFSFTANTEAQKSATFVQCAIHSESSGIVNINGYPLETEEVLLPDGTKYLITKFVLVNGSFATGAFISGDVAYIFDGITDDAFTAEAKVTSSSSSTSSLDALFYHDRGSFHVSSLEGLENQTSDITGSFSSTTLSLLEGFTEQISPMKFEAAVDTGSSVYGIYEWTIVRSDIPNADPDLFLQDGAYAIFNYVRPILSVGDVIFDVYDYLLTNGRMGMLNVSGSLQTGFSIKIPIILSDKGPRSISITEEPYVEGPEGFSLSYLHISDGNENGAITVSSCIGVVEIPAPEPEPEPLEALFYHDRGSFYVVSLEDLENQTENISGSFTTTTLPLLEGFSEQIAPMKLDVAVDEGSSVYGVYEWSFLGTDVPGIDADAIRENINNIFDYVRPILSVGNIVFDVYDYLAVNGKLDLLNVSGSLQAGFSIKVPIILSDKAPRNVSIEENRLCISDGNENGIAAVGSYIGILERPTEPTEEPLLSTQNIRLEKADAQLKLPEADAIFELGAVATWPGKEGVLAATFVGSFVGTYDGVGKYAPLKVTISIAAADLRTLSQSGYGAMLAGWQESPSVFFDRFHVYKQVGNFIYDLVMMGGKDAFTISGDPTTRINISFNVALVDDLGLVLFDEAQSAFIVYDGIGDGKLIDPLFIGAIALEKPEEKPTQPVISSSTMSLKLVDIDASSLGLEEAEADFEYVGLTDWPDKEGVLKAISVGSFEGEYDGTGKYVPLKMEISVTSYDLDVLSKDRHAKVISKWVEDSSAFLDYFHVYKQIGDAIYDLVMMGGKDAFTVSGDPTTRVTISFPVVLVDDIGNSYHDETMGFVIYDGEKDGKLVDPLFVGTPEQVPVEETEEDEEEVKHILPDNPEGPSTGHSDLDKWIKIFSLF